MNNWESQEQPDQPEAIWNNLEHMMDNSGIWWEMVNNTEYEIFFPTSRKENDRPESVVIN